MLKPHLGKNLLYSQSFSNAVARCTGAAIFWYWLAEYSGVVLSCFTLSRSTIFAEISLINPEDVPIQWFKAVLYSVSRVRNVVNKFERKKSTGHFKAK